MAAIVALCIAPAAFASPTPVNPSPGGSPITFVQTADQSGAVLDAVNVTGTTDILAGLVKVSINTQEGDQLSTIKPDDIKTQVLDTGYFKTATVTLRSEGGKNTLDIKVEPNPVIGAVTFSGNAVVDTKSLNQLLDQQLTLGPGVTYNPARVEESRATISQYYRNAGLPFSPVVTVKTATQPNGDLDLAYTIDETAKISKVVVTGATVVPTNDLQVMFAGLVQKGTFDAPGFASALQQVAQRYAGAGYRGSGVNVAGTELVDGSLNVAITELKVATIDASSLGVDATTLGVKPGDLFNYDKVLQQVQALSKGRDRQVAVKVEQASTDSVSLTITLQDQPAGPIESIQVTGNSVVSTPDVLKVLRQKPGDTFNTQVASDGDFQAINELYSARGYALVPQPGFEFKTGVYSITVREQKLVGYQLRWNGAHRTREEVVTRELPKPGGLLNLNAFRKGLAKLQQTGLFSNIRPNAIIPDATRPDEAVLTLELDEARTGIFSPSFGYNTLTGFEGSLGYSETNLWGLNHTASVNIQAGQNDAGQQLSGGASYTIPWLYLDFLDFKDVRTSVSLSLSSTVVGGQTLAGTEPTVGSPSGAVSRTYSTRSNGFGVNLTRPIGEFITLGLAYNLQYQSNYLERKGGVTYAMDDDATARPLAQALDNYTNFVNATGEFNTRNSIDFPTTGVFVNGSVGYGFGGQKTQTLSYTQETLGARTYLGLGLNAKSNSLELNPAGPVALAFRFNAGTILGVAPTSRQFALGDSGQVEDFRVRGYGLGDVRGEVFYSTSAEFRYNFGLKTAVTSGLIGVAFLDVGNAWGNGSRATRTLTDGTVISIPDGPIVGYGIGLQVNLGFGAFQLPALRFDYGFSQWNPTGRFSFRLGFPF